MIARPAPPHHRPRRRFGRRRAAGTAFALALLLAGCGGKDKGRHDIMANGADQALDGALGDQIIVDSRGAGSGGAPGTPLHVPPPTPAGAAGRGLTLGELAKSQAAPGARTAECDKTFRMAPQWADRLPTALPLYPGARVSEAAGNDSPGCRVRIVSFTSTAALGTILDYYYASVIRAGYTAEHQLSGTDHILGGTREKDGSAYYLIASARDGGGTQVDIVANHGR